MGIRIKKHNGQPTVRLGLTLHPLAQDLEPEHQDDAREKHQNSGHQTLCGEIHNHLAYIRRQNPDLNLHVISLAVDENRDRTSRMNADPQWLAQLEKMGYEDGRKWLKTNARHLGKKSTYEPPSYG